MPTNNGQGGKMADDNMQDILSDFDSNSTQDSEQSATAADIGSEETSEGQQEVDSDREVGGFKAAYLAEKRKRQDMQKKFGETESKMGNIQAKLDEFEKKAEYYESRMGQGKAEADLTPEEQNNRKLFNELTEHVGTLLFNSKIKPELDKLKTQQESLYFDKLISSFQNKYGLSEERLDEVMDYAEQTGIKGERALEEAYFAMVGRKYAQTRSSDANERRKKFAGISLGSSTSTAKPTWFKPYDSEKGQRLSDVIREAKQEYRDASSS